MFANFLMSRESQKDGSRILVRLAETLEKNHNDPWLSEFLRSKKSQKANELMSAAIFDNIAGKTERALHEALKAQQLYDSVGNDAGSLRSQLESTYALRRQLRGKECQDRFSSLSAVLRRHQYVWLRIRILVEVSGCVAMTSDFDRAWHMAKEAAEEARSANYLALQLRALGYLASFHTIEGRLSQSWQTNESGLRTFWSGVFPRDRAYQFYADLEFAAEKAEQWHLAAALQREALEEFRDSQRRDFIAAAHCRLARMEEILGDVQRTQEELRLSRTLFEQLGKDSDNPLNEADCEVGWGSLESRYGSIDSATQHLRSAKQIVEKANSFTIHLRYEQAWAVLEKRRENRKEEQDHLEKALAIANQGFQALRSPRDRWEWRRDVNQLYRQLLELEVERPHNSQQIFAQWESFRAIDMPDPALHAGQFGKNSPFQKIVPARLENLRQGSVVAFAVFPRWVTAWVANDEGVHEFRLPVDSETLEKDVKAFYQLCSSPLTPLEKVNDAGSRLYQLLIAPIEGALDPARTLFIEADEALGLLPWPALLRADGSYFGHVYALVNTPGLLYEKPRISRRHMMDRMLVAYPGAVELDNTLYQPLPQAKDEADFVAGLAPHSTYLQGNEVSAKNLLAALPQASSFVFSGHATTRAYSGELVIHGQTGGDVFSASRLAGMNLTQTKLVVLSACSTGGEPETANDPNGLVKAFLNAGAERVIATQWDVSSGSTADLVRDFFTSLRKNQASKPALREAWKNVASSSSHPYYWAAFQAYGPAE